MNYIKPLVILGLFLSSQISFAADDCSYKVIKVKSPDTLTIRTGPGRNSQKVGGIPATANDVKIIGDAKQIRNSKWAPIKYNNIYGWVNRGYLKKDCPVITKNKLYHVVKSGEGLYGIARKYHYSVQQIAKWNNLAANDGISVGQRLWISPPTLSSRGGSCSDYKVVNVKANDFLSARSGAGVKNKLLFGLPANANKIKITGNEKRLGRSKWVPIKYLKMEAWVNRRFLKEDC
ncbi:LysM peptidoglycan-binding domain-containing protein [Candidatus Marithrix sp. Canyon 246]|uniref:LysM peptidoglycan-binding domain-containing protein n=1 Tax=Candidatus Marithrix sp. Canyon 246 TaxID=1827136 RepID=UPI00084A0E50|nr:LysM peptidoglycan-binding domain-containing protein [Candidatus Marithrix sp. Canyon 246]